MAENKNIPVAIKQLHLCTAFQGYAKSLMECIEISNEKEILVVDDDDKHISCIVTAGDFDDKCFHAINPNSQEIILLSIDHNLIKNNKGVIADCAVFSTSVFSFVEFKANAEGHSQKAIDGTYQKAIKQLTETLNLFIRLIKKAHSDLLEAAGDVNCHIVVNQKFPRTNAMENECIIRFMEENHVELSFEPSQKF
jgi:hypothetical protein